MTLRHLLRRSPLYRPYRRAKYRLRSSAREELFANFFRENIWGDAESRSGAGSSLQQTAHLREQLPPLLHRLGIQSLLDVPCGDFVWMQHVDLTGIHYVGGDIVSDLVCTLQQKYGGPGRQFVRLDVVNDELPSVDAVMVRDLFLHLPLAMVQRAIGNLRRCGATWLLTSNYPEIGSNPDIDMGQHRFLNLALPPFSWPPPLEVIDERSSTEEGRTDKQLALWRLDQIPV